MNQRTIVATILASLAILGVIILGILLGILYGTQRKDINDLQDTCSDCQITLTNSSTVLVFKPIDNIYYFETIDIDPNITLFNIITPGPNEAGWVIDGISNNKTLKIIRGGDGIEITDNGTIVTVTFLGGNSTDIIVDATFIGQSLIDDGFGPVKKLFTVEGIYPIEAALNVKTVEFSLNNSFIDTCCVPNDTCLVQIYGGESITIIDNGFCNYTVSSNASDIIVDAGFGGTSLISVGVGQIKELYTVTGVEPIETTLVGTTIEFALNDSFIDMCCVPNDTCIVDINAGNGINVIDNGLCNFTIESNSSNICQDLEDNASLNCLSDVNTTNSENDTCLCFVDSTWKPTFVTGLITSLLWSNVLIVDPVNGDDSLGAAGVFPYETINGAIVDALSGQLILIVPGTYNESFTIPDGVAVRGVSLNSVKIFRTPSSTTEDFITMGENTRLEDVNLKFTATSHGTYRGIVFPGTTGSTAKFRISVLTMDLSGVPIPGSSTVIGAYSNGTGIAPIEFTAFRAVTISLLTGGTGSTAYGLLMDSNTQKFNIRDTNIISRKTGSAVGGTFIGVITNYAGCNFTARTSSIEGDTADISQTLGEIFIGTTDLINSNANGLGFQVTLTPSFMTFGDPGPLATGTRYFYPGTESSTLTEIKIRIPTKCLARSLAVNSIMAVGGILVNTITVRKNGVNTILSTTLTGAQTSNTNEAVSVTFNAGDEISVQTIEPAMALTEGITVVVGFY